jgi:hypothetical protein
MRLEYFNDPATSAPPVLLLFGREPSDAAAIRDALADLASMEPGGELQIDRLAVVDGASLMGVVGQADLGTEPVGDSDTAFRCVLTPESWRTAAQLIEPFTTRRRDGANGFQYLADAGPIDWVISSSREW